MKLPGTEINNFDRRARAYRFVFQDGYADESFDWDGQWCRWRRPSGNDEAFLRSILYNLAPVVGRYAVCRKLDRLLLVHRLE